MKFVNYRSKTFKAGSIFTLLTLLVIIITVLVNILVTFIPTKYTHIDTTYENLFEMSEQTENLLKNLDKEVTIYHLCADGVQDEYISELLNKYASSSPKLTVSVKDTTIYPTFSKKYTDITLSDNSLIVESEKRYITVDYYDIYQASSDEYLYYGVYDLFNGESALTSAIDYVTTKNLPKLYVTEGHSEEEIPAKLSETIEKENFEINTLALNTITEIPKDADCVLMFAPDRDISTSEKDMLITYMQKGGNLMLVSNYTQEKMPNFNALTEYYSLKINDGLVFENDGGNYVPNYPYYIYPNVITHTITDPILNENLHILFPLAHGVTVLDNPRETLDIYEFITTSDTAYSKIDISSGDFKKEEKDINGPFALAVAVTDTADNITSHLVLFSTSQFLETNVNNAVAGANYDLFLNSLGWLCNKKSSISVHAKEMYSTSVAVPENASWLVFICIVIIIPAIFVVLAIVITSYRKRK